MTLNEEMRIYRASQNALATPAREWASIARMFHREMMREGRDEHHTRLRKARNTALNNAKVARDHG